MKSFPTIIQETKFDCPPPQYSKVFRAWVSEERKKENKMHLSLPELNYLRGEGEEEEREEERRGNEEEPVGGGPGAEN